MLLLYLKYTLLLVTLAVKLVTKILKYEVCVFVFVWL